MMLNKVLSESKESGGETNLAGKKDYNQSNHFNEDDLLSLSFFPMQWKGLNLIQYHHVPFGKFHSIRNLALVFQVGDGLISYISLD